MKKIALDEAAKKYWKLLYKELGYGEALVRDIPRRIKAALAENKKVASVDESALLTPFAHAKDGDSNIIEGIYTDSGKTKIAFRVTLDKAGDVSDLRTVTLRG